MEDNLLASIFRTNDKIKECLSQPIDLPLEVSDNSGAVSTDNKTQEKNDKQQPVPNSQQAEDDLELEERYIVSIIGAKQFKDESSIRKGLYIAYEISITRISDGYTKSVFRRFREIRNLYRDLIQVDEDIVSNSHIVFPEYTEGWFGSSQIDPESDLVQRRKSDLQCFFFELFHQFPVFFHHMRVVEFLELKTLPPKSHSTFSMHYAKKVDVEVELSEELISDVIYNTRTGRLEHVNNQANPTIDNINNPSCVEFISHAEKFPRKRIKV